MAESTNEVWNTLPELPDSLFEKLRNETIEWAVDRGIIRLLPEGGADGDLKGQALKMVAEVGELCDEIAAGRKKEARDEAGDVMVTLVLVSKMMGFDLQDALYMALKKINSRTGKMVNGVFVKD